MGKVYYSYTVEVFGELEEHCFRTMAELRKDASLLMKLFKGTTIVEFKHLICKHFCEKNADITDAQLDELIKRTKENIF